jgi:DNA-binding transcriptional regulator GbsR (MarR family)
MSNTAAVCKALLAAKSPLTATEIAEAAEVDVKKVSTILWSLERAGATRTVKSPGERARYEVANQEDMQQRADGTALRRSKRGKAKKAAEAPVKRARKRKPSKKAAKRAKRTPRKVAQPARQLSFFISEDAEYQLVPIDGKGEPFILQQPDAIAFARFVQSTTR